jgi:exodeoxyribonuclease VII small subunit
MTAKKKQTGKPEEMPFEAAMDKLETIVGQLEEGDLALERSLELFEEGVRLSRDCVRRLDAAERRIEILLKDEDDGEDRTEPFEPPDGE